MAAWFSQLEHSLTPTTLALLTAVSLAVVALSALGAAIFVTAIPEDYFVRNGPGPMEKLRGRSPLRYVSLWIARQLLGLALALAGLAMLVLPGQGLLTLLAALCVLEYPGKRRLIRKLVGRKAVRHALNALRQRRGKAPLQF